MVASDRRASDGRELVDDLRAHARLRPLRPVPAHLPDLPRDRPRELVAARSHLPAARGRRGTRAAERSDRRGGLPLSRLSRLRDRLPVGRRVRLDARVRARGGRSLGAARRLGEARRAACAAFTGPEAAPTRVRVLAASRRTDAPRRSRRTGADAQGLARGLCAGPGRPAGS